MESERNHFRELFSWILIQTYGRMDVMMYGRKDGVFLWYVEVLTFLKINKGANIMVILIDFQQDILIQNVFIIEYLFAANKVSTKY